MDKHVIKKIIQLHHGESSCNFTYEKPLLDKNVADLVSKSLVKLLNQDNSSDANRRQLLLTIRKACKVEPPGHLCIDDNVTEMLLNAYKDIPNDYDINKILDSFLIRNLKEMDINSLYSPYFKPEVIQALVNLKDNKRELHNILLKDIIYWNIDGQEKNGYLEILKSMWEVEHLKDVSKTQPDDISIKIKPVIESILLPSIYEMLERVIIEDDDWFCEKEDLIGLVELCSVSNECFQLCCSIMNTIFIKTEFDIQMLQFITLFMYFVKTKVENISQLYSSNLQHIVLLLDINLDNLEEEIKNRYIEQTLEYLHGLHNESESDVIMLLSHFNQWFDHYYKAKAGPI